MHWSAEANTEGLHKRFTIGSSQICHILMPVFGIPQQVCLQAYLIAEFTGLDFALDIWGEICFDTVHASWGGGGGGGGCPLLGSF